MLHTNIVITEDGSHTLHVPGLGETYHSTHGAIIESRHVFITAGLNQCIKSPCDILEVGFGTGLNALLTCLAADAGKLHLNYTTLEPFPLDEATWRVLNYPALLNGDRSQLYYDLLHHSQWDRPFSISDYFLLHKVNKRFEEVVLPDAGFDLIFFDAFSPKVQPELWAAEVFERLYKASKPEAIMVTYCAKGAVRRNMEKAGFKTERLPGPPGKREMLRARKIIADHY